MFTNNKKFPIALKVILFLLILFLSICIAILIFYKTNIDISSKNSDKFDLNINNSNEIQYNVNDFFDFNTENSPNTLFIDIPKQYLYTNILKIEDLNNELNNNYGITIDKVGLFSNKIDKNNIDFYLNLVYKKYINVYIHGSLNLKVANNQLTLKLNDINIGKLSDEIVDKVLPIHENIVLYEINSNNNYLLKNNIIYLENLEEIDFNQNNLHIEFDILNNIKRYMNEQLNMDLSSNNSILYNDLISFIVNAIVDLIK